MPPSYHPALTAEAGSQRRSYAGITPPPEHSPAGGDGRLAGAGIDVFDTEPLPPDHPMRTAPRLLATPHLGYVSQANYRTYYGQAVENIQAFLAGSPVRRID